MTRSLKRKLSIILLCLGSLSGFLFIYLLDTSVHGLKWKAVLALVYVAIIFALSYFANNHKKPIILTPEEEAQPLEKHMDFSNSFDWFGFIAVSIMVNILEYSYLSYISHSETYSLTEKVILMLIMWAIWTPAFCIRLRNKYIIDDDILIVQEYDLFRKTTDLQIPISTINKVTANNLFSIYNQVVIEVDGVERVLRCYPHADELAIALTRRIPHTPHALTPS